LADYLYNDIYTSNGDKRIPKIILNANRDTKLAFLRGYNAGDGRKATHLHSEFQEFTTKSPILALGLAYLIEQILEVKYRFYVEHRGEERYFKVRPLTQTGTKRGKHLLKSDNEVTSIRKLDYSGEVWDFETRNHRFQAGTGGIIVHNTGPRRWEGYVVPAFAKQIAEIEAGIRSNPIKVGNLDSIRTFADVRDTVRAYWMMMERCPKGEVYNIGGNETMSIGKMLRTLISFAKVPIEWEVSSSLLRPTDVTLQIPDISKFFIATGCGWTPEIPFEQTLLDTLNYQRSRIRG